MFEMLWTLFGLVGVVFGWINLRSSYLDIKALHEINGNTYRVYREMRIIAYGHYRNNLFRFSKSVIILMIGILAMVLPPAPHGASYSATAVVITVGLFAIAVLIAMASALDQRQREALEEMDA